MINRLTTLFYIGFLFLLISCGVETNSTDQGEGEPSPQKVLVQGTVRTTDGGALPGLQLFITESGASTQTDSVGAFSFGELPLGNTVTFVVLGDSFSASSPALSFDETLTTLSVILTLSADRTALAATVEGPTETPQPSVSPTATPSGNQGAYDAQGNTKSFGIPAGITGNRNRGKTKYFQLCGACHTNRIEGTRYNFGQLKRAIAAPPMNISMHDASLADIVAYLRYVGGAR